MALYDNLRQRWGMNESLSDKERLARLQQQEELAARRERDSIQGYLSSGKWGPNTLEGFLGYQGRRTERERSANDLQDRVTQQIEAEQRAGQEEFMRRYDYTPQYDNPLPTNDGRRTLVRPQEQQYTPPQDLGRARLEASLRAVGGHYNTEQERRSRPDLLQESVQGGPTDGRFYGQERDSMAYMMQGPRGYDSSRGSTLRQLDMQDRATHNNPVKNNPSSHYGMESDRPREIVSSSGGNNTWKAILRNYGKVRGNRGAGVGGASGSFGLGGGE